MWWARFGEDTCEGNGTSYMSDGWGAVVDGVKKDVRGQVGWACGEGKEVGNDGVGKGVDARVGEEGVFKLDSKMMRGLKGGAFRTDGGGGGACLGGDGGAWDLEAFAYLAAVVSAGVGVTAGRRGNIGGGKEGSERLLLVGGTFGGRGGGGGEGDSISGGRDGGGG